MSQSKRFGCIFLVFYSIIAIRAQDDLDQYDQLSVLRIKPQNSVQMSSLLQLEQDDEEVDFWKRPDRIHNFADLMITPNNSQRILSWLNQRNIPYHIHIRSVRSLIENERKEMKMAERTRWMMKKINTTGVDLESFWKTYQRASEIEKFMDTIVSQNSNLVTKINFGKSSEGRQLNMIRISIDPEANKPVVYIQGGIHAREWISPAMVTYFANYLVNGVNEKDANVNQLLQSFDFYMTPVLNIDGYEYSHTSNRLWRKTRSSVSSSSCKGVDANRNYDYEWGGVGTSQNPCSDIFKGPSAFSEPETKAEADFILKELNGRAKVMFAVHSYGQYWLYPWGYDSSLTPDNDELNEKARIATQAISKRYGTKYTYGTSTNVLYAAAGATDDWAYGRAGIVYSYTIELRDTGSYGFQLPPAQIIPTSQETIDGIIAMLFAIK